MKKQQNNNIDYTKERYIFLSLAANLYGAFSIMYPYRKIHAYYGKIPPNQSILLGIVVILFACLVCWNYHRDIYNNFIKILISIFLICLSFSFIFIMKKYASYSREALIPIVFICIALHLYHVKFILLKKTKSPS
jgi:hypothetical protein